MNLFRPISIKYSIYISIFLIFTLKSFSNIDSLEKILKSAPRDTNRIKILNSLSAANRDISVDQTINYSQQALELSYTLNSKQDIAESLKNLGVGYWLANNLSKALEELFNAVDIYEELHNIKGVSQTTNNIGLVYYYGEQYGKSEALFKKAIELDKSINNKLGLSREYHNLGLVYLDTKRFDEALQSFFYSLDKCVEMKDSNLIGKNLCFIGRNYLQKNDLANAYNYIIRSYDIFHKVQNTNNIAMACNQLSIFYISTKDYKLALKYSHDALSLGLKVGNKYMQKEALDYMSQAYSGLKKYDSANKYNREYANMLDSIKRDESVINFTQKEIQYENEKKLHSLQNAQLIKINANAIYIKVAIVGIIILIIIALILFRLYRNRTKTNIILEENNKLISSQKEELLVLNDNLAELNATKDKFFSIIAHDLINPIGNFREMSKMLCDSYSIFSENEIVEFLVSMKESSNNVYALLDNLLQWSRSQRGLLKLYLESFDLATIAKDSIQLLQPIALKKSIRIENSIQESTMIIADPNLLITVIRNLLSNAIKFTPTNGIILLGATKKEKSIQVFIKDSGVGISEERISKLFKIDENNSTDGTAQEKGTGFGLILCKEFIEKHGGKIWVESQQGAGSTFIFELSNLAL